VTAWLDPLRRALDEAPHPVPVFFRDDDAGWADDALRALMDRFARAGVPLDVAVIPGALTRRLTAELVSRVESGGGLVALHQHGWAHANHEPQGRRCEFGPARSADDQRADLARGLAVMRAAFGPDDAPLFVPPWNRCTATTATVLAELGFAVLCRDVTATELPGSPLPELPVTADWFARRRGVRVDRDGRGDLLAAAARDGRPLGVMLHHAVTTDDDLDDLDDLLRLVAASPAVALRTMADVARAIPATG
jgi:peptidoglycan/xylan/chitin deacetylase (PgdA/CDA1 family)